ncbi:MAG TPA: DUF4157 domain-containing protein [Acidimicrobiales bacterium]
MEIRRRDGAVIVVSRFAAPGAAATTLGRFVFVRRSAVGSERLMRHELVHVRQWRELGVPRFLVRYLGAYLRWRLRAHPHWAAYRRIPLEIRAEWEARGPQRSASRQRQTAISEQRGPS